MKTLPILLSIAIFSTACSKKDPEPSVIIDTPTLNLKYDQQHQFALKKGTEDIFASTFTWKSSDEKVGKVDANGRFTARKIGETTITGTSGGASVQSKVTISPYVTIFTEPVLEFGTTMATVKAKEKRKLLLETSTGLAYEGSVGTQTRGVMYVFADQKLTSAGILFDNTSATVTTSTTFMKERYPDRATIDNKVYFLNDERTMGVVMTVDADYGLMALYIPYSPGGRLTAENEASALKSFKELAKIF